MKSKTISSLFFCFLVVGFLIPTKVFAQKKIDSANYYYRVIINPENSKTISEAFLFYKKRIENFIKQKDTLGAVQDLRLVAIGQYYLGFYHDSEITVVNALKLLEGKEEVRYSEAKWGLFNILGMVYRSLNNPTKALEYYENSLEFAANFKDSIRILNNRANIYSDQNRYELALVDLTLVYKGSLLQDNVKIKTRAQDNLGFVQSKLGYPEGLSNMLKALEIRIQENDISGLCANYNHLTEIYNDKNNEKEALKYANKGYVLAKSINSASFLEKALSNLLKISKDTIPIEYINISESISLAKQQQENKNANIKYNLEIEKRNTRKAELEKEKEERKSIIYQAGILFIFLGAIFLYVILRSRYREKNVEQIYKTETRISEKIHDEVANEVYHVMTQLQSIPNVNEAVMDELDAIYSKTRDISKENSAIDLTDNFAELLHDLLLSYKNLKVSIITKDISKINWDTLSEIKKITLYRVLQELMTNMRKHSKASHVVLTFSQIRNGVSIIYKDNGIGGKLHKSTGLQNAENRIKTIKGKIIFESESNQGFTVKFII